MLRDITIEGSGAPHQARLTRRGRVIDLWIDGTRHALSVQSAGAAHEITIGDRTERVWTVAEGDVVHVHAFGRAWTVHVVDPADRPETGAAHSSQAKAPMPGVIIAVHVEPGQAVTKGQPLIVMESMKMQTEIIAPRDGVIARVHHRPGETIERGSVLVSLAPTENG